MRMIYGQAGLGAECGGGTKAVDGAHRLEEPAQLWYRGRHTDASQAVTILGRHGRAVLREEAAASLPFTGWNRTRGKDDPVVLAREFSRVERVRIDDVEWDLELPEQPPRVSGRHRAAILVPQRDARRMQLSRVAARRHLRRRDGHAIGTRNLLDEGRRRRSSHDVKSTRWLSRTVRRPHRSKHDHVP